MDGIEDARLLRRRHAISALRGNGFQSRLLAASIDGRKLIDVITNKDGKDCPVPAALTEADKAMLLRVKQEAAD